MSTYAALCICLSLTSADLTVNTDFPGGSGTVVLLDQATRSLTIQPTPHKDTGWECWWYFQLSGVTPGEEITLTVKSMVFGLPRWAGVSYDNKTWKQTPPGKADKGTVTYKLKFDQEKIWLAWGPPFQKSDAEELIERTVKKNVGATKFELARTKFDRPVPALRWDPPAKEGVKRRGIWLQSRQHAWESGSSWVGAGMVDWIASDDPEAKALRETTRIVYVPIMDIDNVEIGAGGKDQKPHDHNRDWSAEPVFTAVAAAQKGISEMNEAGEFNLFIDLHNPAPDDSKPFFYAVPANLLSPERAKKQGEWLAAAEKFLGAEKLSLAKDIKESGPGYHPLWRQISKTWVVHNTRDHVVACTLETSWNTPNSTQEGYQAYGRALGKAIHLYLQQP
ncbi:M14-type cytosolic carboxypeptidase [Anatilimnocola floriformis]|uniref:M14-type cytosolic carboxypeptidase n=1 Tax=Anatilimnocola floriformis TaxID=2948575 RepID=UPI0020C519A5|nr:M14-type cytosolic carboxypeptidase [Anatilimnocola floriformis]